MGRNRTLEWLAVVAINAVVLGCNSRAQTPRSAAMLPLPTSEMTATSANPVAMSAPAPATTGTAGSGAAPVAGSSVVPTAPPAPALPASGQAGNGAMSAAGAGANAGNGPGTVAGSAGAGSATDPGFSDKDFYNPVMPCEKGKLKGSEIIIMGESFYALSGEIQRNVEALAKAAGSPNPYRGFAVSGTTLGNNQIPSQYDRALMGGDIKLVIMDGGGNDQYNRYCEECPGIVEKLFAHMAENGTQDVLYTFYPDPGNPIGSAPFKKYHDMLRLTIREVCTKTTALRCHFLDLRPFWKAGDTDDGLHPTASGARHVADAIWAFMQKDCLGQ